MRINLTIVRSLEKENDIVLSYYLMQILGYSKYVVSVAGVLVSAWGVRKYRKAGYAVLAIYFLLPFVWLAIRPLFTPDPALLEILAEAESAAQEVLSESQNQTQITLTQTETRTIELPIGEAFVLAAVTLLVLKEQQRRRGEPTDRNVPSESVPDVASSGKPPS